MTLREILALWGEKKGISCCHMVKKWDERIDSKKVADVSLLQESSLNRKFSESPFKKIKEEERSEKNPGLRKRLKASLISWGQVFGETMGTRCLEGEV